MFILKRSKVESLKTRGNIKGLVDILNHKDWWEREASAKVLGEIKDKRAVNPLVKRLEVEETIPVVKELVRALGEIGDPLAVDMLLETFYQNNNLSVQEDAALALKKIGFGCIADEDKRLEISMFCDKKAKEVELRLSFEQKLVQRKIELEENNKIIEDEERKLSSSGLIGKFVEEKKGVWDNQNWLELLSSLRDAGYTNIPEDNIKHLLEKEKQSFINEQLSKLEQEPCEICNQYPTTVFSFLVAKVISQTTKISGTLVYTKRTYTYTYALEGSRQVWLCNNCLEKESLKSARSNVGCASVGLPIAIAIVWVIAYYLMLGQQLSVLAKYVCLLPLALAISVFLVFLLVTYIKDLNVLKQDKGYLPKYVEKYKIGENLAINLHKDELKQQGYSYFTQKQWDGMKSK